MARDILMNLEALIERLEKLQKGDREVDCDICLIVKGHPKGEWEKFDRPNLLRNVEDDDWWPVPHYTSSIDAALTLVQDEKDWSLQCDIESNSTMQIKHYVASADGSHSFRDGGDPAIALCIAALKARKGA